MVALASIDDYAVITGAYPADTVRVTRLIEMASDAVLAGAHGQQIVSAAFEATVTPYEGVAYLPQRPVTAITSVTLNGATVAPSLYRLRPGGHRRPATLTYLTTAGAPRPWGCGELIVSGVAGWDPVPGQIVAMVVSIAHGAVESGGSAGVVGEGTGPFRVELDRDHVQAPDMSLSASSQRILDRLCGVDRHSSLPILRDQL